MYMFKMKRKKCKCKIAVNDRERNSKIDVQDEKRGNQGFYVSLQNFHPPERTRSSRKAREICFQANVSEDKFFVDVVPIKEQCSIQSRAVTRLTGLAGKVKQS